MQSWETNPYKLNEQYQGLVWSETDPGAFEADLQACDAYAGELASIFLGLRSRVAAMQPPSSLSDAHRNTVQRHIQLKSPLAEIPKLSDGFSGSRMVNYFKEFEVVVNRYKFDTTEKFGLLKENISVKPLTIVQNMKFRDYYEKANYRRPTQSRNN